jgi:Uma2 family endonuclease
MEVKEPAVSYSRYYTLEQYEQLEADEGCRYEYWHGEVFAMAGASLAHNEIGYNITKAFKDKGPGGKCRAFQEGAKLQLDEGNIYVYPDVMLTCHPADLEATKYVQHPTILVEILSDSTELHDRSTKWKHYRRLRSLRYLLLVSQHVMQVEVYKRASDNALFSFQEFTQPDDVIHFEEPGFAVTLEEIYRDIQFPVQEDSPDAEDDIETSLID